MEYSIIPQYTYPFTFTYWRTSWLLPGFTNYEYRSCKHSWTDFCVDKSFQCLLVNTKEQDWWIIYQEYVSFAGNSQDTPKWLCVSTSNWLCISTSNKWGFLLLIFSIAFGAVSVLDFGYSNGCLSVCWCPVVSDSLRPHGPEAARL